RPGRVTARIASPREADARLTLTVKADSANERYFGTEDLAWTLLLGLSRLLVLRASSNTVEARLLGALDRASLGGTYDHHLRHGLFTQRSTSVRRSSFFGCPHG